MAFCLLKIRVVVALLVCILLMKCKWTAAVEVDTYPFLMPDVQPLEPDTYFCTTLKVDTDRTLYITGFAPNATAETAHHILIYGCREPGSRDDVWDCGEMNSKTGKNNVETAPVCASGAQVIYAWAHHAPKLTLPEGVGFKIGKGSSIKYLVLQVHYASVWRFSHDGETDNSGIVLSVTDEKMPKRAGVYLLGTNGRILGKSTETMETACHLSENVELHPFAFRTHTHALGKVVAGYLVRKKWVFDFQPKWSRIGKKNPQDAQMFYPTDDPKMVIRKGDILAARCTMVNKKDKTVRIGPTVDDEMCNFYIMYWVNGDNTLKDQYCFSYGPPIFYWNRYLLFNIPDKDASSL